MQNRSQVTLAQLLAPVSLQTFVDEHFAGSPLYVAADRRKRALVSALFDRVRFHEAIERASRAHDPGSFQIKAIFPPGHSGGTDLRIEPHQVNQLVGAGASICVHDVHQGDQRLAELIYTTRHALSLVGPVGMSCYLSPPGRGLSTHFDAQAVLTIQVEGTKLWRYSEKPAVMAPRANGILGADGRVQWASDSPGDLELPAIRVKRSTLRLKSVTLRPGDVLFLPPGHWHETEAGGPSLGLTMYFVPMAFSALLERWLWSLFEGNDAWFSGVPPAVAQPRYQRLPDGIDAFVAQRLGELQAKLKQVSASDTSFMRSWRRFIAQSAPARVHSQTRAVTLGARLRNAGHPIALIGHPGRDGAVFLCVDDKELMLPQALGPLISLMMSKKTFRAKPVRGLSWEETRGALEALVGHGVLEFVT